MSGGKRSQSPPSGAPTTYLRRRQRARDFAANSAFFLSCTHASGRSRPAGAHRVAEIALCWITLLAELSPTSVPSFPSCSEGNTGPWLCTSLGHSEARAPVATLHASHARPAIVTSTFHRAVTLCVAGDYVLELLSAQAHNCRSSDRLQATAHLTIQTADHFAHGCWLWLCNGSISLICLSVWHSHLQS